MDAKSPGEGGSDVLAGTLAQVLRRHLPAESAAVPVDPQVDLGALGLGSVELAVLIVDLEGTFGVEFPEHMLVPETFRTAGTVVGAIAALTGQQGPGG
ncbi:MAG: phosphopantetheine-binding protein [Streptosporangiaceae bacterium]